MQSKNHSLVCSKSELTELPRNINPSHLVQENNSVNQTRKLCFRYMETLLQKWSVDPTAFPGDFRRYLQKTNAPCALVMDTKRVTVGLTCGRRWGVEWTYEYYPTVILITLLWGIISNVGTESQFVLLQYRTLRVTNYGMLGHWSNMALCSLTSSPFAHYSGLELLLSSLSYGRQAWNKNQSSNPLEIRHGNRTFNRNIRRQTMSVGQSGSPYVIVRPDQ